MTVSTKKGQSASEGAWVQTLRPTWHLSPGTNTPFLCWALYQPTSESAQAPEPASHLGGSWTFLSNSSLSHLPTSFRGPVVTEEKRTRNQNSKSPASCLLKLQAPHTCSTPGKNMQTLSTTRMGAEGLGCTVWGKVRITPLTLLSASVTLDHSLIPTWHYA